ASCYLLQGSPGFQRSYTYDGLGRPITIATTTPEVAVHTDAGYDTNGRLILLVSSSGDAGYDTNGRLILLVSSSGLAVSYGYTSQGYVQQLSDAHSGQVFWTANARDAELHLTQDTAGNGVVTSRTFDPTNGRLTNIRAGTSNAVAAFDYTYDFE